MISVSHLLNSAKSDSCFTIESVLNNFNVQYTLSNIRNSFKHDLEYPSILAIKDGLATYDISGEENFNNKNQYVDLEAPFVSTIQQKAWSEAVFVVVIGAEQSSVTYLDQIKSASRTIFIESFESNDKGPILLMDYSQKIDKVVYT